MNEYNLIVELKRVRRQLMRFDFYPKREGNVSIDRVISEFGLKNIVFGKSSEGERTDMLNALYDALMLMAEILAVPRVTLGLAETLSVTLGSHAFGRNTRASYSPADKSINFRTNYEFGSLAHEWMHAFDHYCNVTLCQGDPMQLKSATKADVCSDFWREPLAQAWNSLIDALDSPNFISRSETASQKSQDPYWLSKWELLARAFETYILFAMKKRKVKNRTLVNPYPFNPYPNPGDDKVIWLAFDRFFEEIVVIHFDGRDSLGTNFNQPNMKITIDNIRDMWPDIERKMPEAIVKHWSLMLKAMPLYYSNETAFNTINIFISKVNAVLDKHKEEQNEPEAEQEAYKELTFEHWSEDILKLLPDNWHEFYKILKSLWNRYYTDDNIKSRVDKYLGMVNEYFKKHHIKWWEKVSVAPKPQPQPKQEPKPKAASPQPAVKPKKKPVTKTPKPAKAPEVEKEHVDSMPLSIKLMRRYIALHGKVFSAMVKDEARKVLSALQLAIVQKQIRKVDKYAKELQEIQSSLTRLVKQPADLKVTLTIKHFDQLRAICTGVEVSPEVKWLSAYIRIVGKENVMVTAKRLLAKISPDYVPQRYAAEMKAAIKSLNEYVGGKTDLVYADEQALNGISSLTGIKAAPVRLHRASAAELSRQHFDCLQLKGKWGRLIGKPNAPYKLMIYGAPGSGKSTLALQYAGHLADVHGQHVLYVAAEEGLSYTMKEKLSRLNICSRNLTIVDAMPADLSAYDTIFIDSVNHIGLEPEELRELPDGKSFVYVMQTTKTGLFRGSQQFLHDVDTSIKVDNMCATTEKNRFGSVGSCSVR